MAWIETAGEDTKMQEKDLSGADTERWQKDTGELPGLYRYLRPYILRRHTVEDRTDNGEGRKVA
jgi:hypothetical protein